jgi:hypothetical protein
MRGLANGRLANIAGGAIVIGICFAGAAYGIITIFPNWLGQ